MSSSTSSSFEHDGMHDDLHERALDLCNDQVSGYPSTTLTQSSSTLYVPIASPPTPAPSPRLSMSFRPTLHPESIPHGHTFDPAHNSRQEFANLATIGSAARRQYLASILHECTPSELLFISTTIAPLLKRDFLKELPTELSLYILCFVDDPRTLARASQVSRHWQTLLSDEWTWKRMCDFYYFDTDRNEMRHAVDEDDEEPLVEMERFADYPLDPALQWLMAQNRKKHKSAAKPSVCVTDALRPRELLDKSFSYRRYFKHSYKTMMNWRRNGQLLRAHRVPVVNPDSGVITSVALDADWVVVGLANSRIHVFSAKTGVLSRTLIGHELGVWAVNLVSRGGYWGDDAMGSRHKRKERRRRKEGRWDEDDVVARLGSRLASMPLSSVPPGADHLVPPSWRTALGLEERSGQRQSSHGDGACEADMGNDDCPELELNPGKRSDDCCATEGWGQPNALAVSGGCDKVLRIWDVKSGYCIYALPGHTSTIRCIKVLHNRPTAVTGSRDSTLRVWDVQRGRMLRVLQGHQQSVRCLDVCGNKVVSGSYDTTLRLWNVDTGECLHVMRGHFHQIYSVAFDGVHIASGGLDTTVRVWNARTGHCVALLQGHTALVCQLQLGPGILATGGSDGRVITFSLSTFAALQRIAAHDSSVTSLQFDQRFLVTGGNDGRVRLFETKTGTYVRELTEPCESVWKVIYRKDTCAIMCKRAGKTVMEIWSYKPKEDM